MSNLQKKYRGLTLIECILAIALSAMIFVPLSKGFILALRSWEANVRHTELIEHARLAMFRLTTELKYATRLLQAGFIVNPVLEFETKTLEDPDPVTVETVKFEVLTGMLTRAVDRGVGYEGPYNLAGDAPGGNISISSLQFTPKKIIGNNLVGLSVPPDPLEDAIAMQIDLTMIDKEGHTVSVSSLIRMRNL